MISMMMMKMTERTEEKVPWQLIKRAVRRMIFQNIFHQIFLLARGIGLNASCDRISTSSKLQNILE